MREHVRGLPSDVYGDYLEFKTGYFWHFWDIYVREHVRGLPSDVYGDCLDHFLLPITLFVDGMLANQLGCFLVLATSMAKNREAVLMCGFS